MYIARPHYSILWLDPTSSSLLRNGGALPLQLPDHTQNRMVTRISARYVTHFSVAVDNYHRRDMRNIVCSRYRPVIVQ